MTDRRRRDPELPDAPDACSVPDLPPGRAQRAGSQRCISTCDVLGPDGVLWIEHEGEIYVLRRTRAGRLILTK